jgi:hypothetical protein
MACHGLQNSFRILWKPLPLRQTATTWARALPGSGQIVRRRYAANTFGWSNRDAKSRCVHLPAKHAVAIQKLPEMRRALPWNLLFSVSRSHSHPILIQARFDPLSPQPYNQRCSGSLPALDSLNRESAEKSIRNRTWQQRDCGPWRRTNALSRVERNTGGTQDQGRARIAPDG